MLRPTRGYGYDDLLLVPQKGVLSRRSEASVMSPLFVHQWLSIPIVSAPMSSVTEWEMAVAMGVNGGLGIIHRMMSIEDQVAHFLTAAEHDVLVACAIGIDDYERLDHLYEHGCAVFCIDVAHAHCDKMEHFLKFLNKKDSRFIVGNVGTAEGALFLEDLGADCIKVGIGPGAACTTRTVTGFGSPMLTAIDEIASVVSVPVMADGGIKNSGDIVKALAAGADTVMLGRLLAGCDEAPMPGEYFGMASRRVNQHHAPEGIEGKIESAGSVNGVLKNLVWGLRSGISYGGASDIAGLQRYAEWQEVGYGTHIETATRL